MEWRVIVACVVGGALSAPIGLLSLELYAMVYRVIHYGWGAM